MAGGFPVGFQWSAMAGSAPSSSGGIAVAPSDTADTVGDYVELISSTPRASTWLMVSIQDPGPGTGVITAAINIATGAADSEAVLIANLIVARDSISSIPGTGATYMLPAVIPAGTRISASSQSSNPAPAAPRVSVIPFDDAFGSIVGGGAIDTFGFDDTTTRGALIDPGSTGNTKGAYTEIVSSTTYDMAGFVLAFESSGSTGSATIAWTVDVAVGASGSEVIVLPDLQLYGRGVSSTYKVIAPSVTPFLPIQIPAGSRVAIRAQCNQTSSAPRVFGAVLYGVRL